MLSNSCRPRIFEPVLLRQWRRRGRLDAPAADNKRRLIVIGAFGAARCHLLPVEARRGIGGRAADAALIPVGAEMGRIGHVR